VDADGDGVANELLPGEMSALDIFLTTMDRPVQLRAKGDARRGRRRFRELGCADCHKPVMTTDSRVLSYRFPEKLDDPSANVYASVDLSTGLPSFDKRKRGGLEIPMFSDLKRHDMGPGLAETVGSASDQTNREFITAKLWGVADSAPYLHDGRAQTLAEAIRLHGGEAEAARTEFEALPSEGKSELIAFLHTLRLPDKPNADVVPH
jgi:CxxC motif-containing protein (DUF1111 family)